MITAICEMADQARCIEDARLIENTQEAMQAYEDDMEEMMGWYGFQIYFFDTECSGIEDFTEEDVYKFMNVNAHLEIDV